MSEDTSTEKASADTASVGKPPAEKIEEAEVRTWIVAFLAIFLNLEPDEVRSDEPFISLGLDSADSILVGGALEDRFNVEIDATLFLRNDTIDALIADLRNSGFVT